ncbi:MAG TPA: endonuclease/exonuclease/phosphatase family protein [bacterium]|nr:endonuclease/exonuclease/phosphatase family protein [bacterium]
MSRSSMVFLLIAVVSTVACEKFMENDVNVAPRDLTEVSFLTLNTGLDPQGVLNYADRKKTLPQALYDTGADILCLQEVWKEADQKEIITNLKEVFPYRFYKTTKQEALEPIPASCTEEDLTPMAMCYFTNCGETDTSDVMAIGLCLLTNCLTEITGIPAECRDCLIGAISSGSTDLAGIMAECTGEQEATEMAQGGNNGLLLLSSLPLKGAKLEKFDSFFYQRAYIYAIATHPLFGDIEIVCTQFTDAVPDMAYEGTVGSWQGETASQAQAIIDLAPGKGTVLRVLMGDLAAGPAIGRDIKAKNPSIYDMLYYAYYYNPFLEPEEASPACTLCADNVLTAAGTQDTITDHVLFTPFDGLKLSAERVLDAGFVLTDKSGKEKTVQYSDHYGIKATLSR